ncbi:hypothetical protein [Pseudanabaena sp. Chao 1811]|uniref:hypothetical protein n=1 Tax=Pseudanabaena sp. Chao 1811 TaxID=2963092 RepID=UPI0022F40347|nr:hypothetical protein [Pseudanabaena sp. Chao 1811]
MDDLIPIIAIALTVTALCAQNQTKRFFESVALQYFQKISSDRHCHKTTKGA